MRNLNFDNSVSRMKDLMKHGEKDAKLKPNVSETVEYKILGPDGKTYGIVREKLKYYIKESTDGVNFNYIGGFPNKVANEHHSYNSAHRNLELKLRSISESLNVNKAFDLMPKVEQSEYIVEATQDMRNEIDRQRQIMMGAGKIMNEKVEFINKPKFKDTESFGTATDPEKQGEPFTDETEAELDTDPNFKATDPEKQGGPFVDEVEAELDTDPNFKATDPEKQGNPFTDKAENILDNPMVIKSTNSGKVIKVTEAQMALVKKYLSEQHDQSEMNEDEDLDLYVPNDMSSMDDYEEENFDMPDDDEDFLEKEKYTMAFPIPSKVKYIGNDPKMLARQNKFGNFEYVGQGERNKDISYIMLMHPDGRELEYEVPTTDLVKVGVNENVNEGIWDTIKAVGSVGKFAGNKAAQGVKDKVVQGVNAVKNYGNEVSQVYNKSQAASSQQKIDKIAEKLKNELINLNSRISKSGGEPLNLNSVIQILANKLRSQVRTNESSNEEVQDEEMVEGKLNDFGKHPNFKKEPFTTKEGKAELDEMVNYILKNLKKKL